MVKAADGDVRRCELGDKAKVTQALERIRTLCPTAEIGYWKKAEA